MNRLRPAAFAFVAFGVCAQEEQKPKPAPPVEAPTKVEFKSTAVFEPTAAIPVFKIKQGEKFKLFDGIGGGIRWTPHYNSTRTDKSFFYGSALVMLSSSTQVDSAGNKDQVNVMSLGLVLGYDWFQIGYGRDVITSESSDVFAQRKKNFMMLNLAGKITF